MEYKISKNLQKYIDLCRNTNQFLSVTVSEPTDAMLGQISDAYTFTTKPTLFKFILKNSIGIEELISIIVPIEVWSSMKLPPIEEFRTVVDRFIKYPSSGCTLFIKPDTKESIPLHGYSIVPISDPSVELIDLLDTISKITDIELVTAHKVIDPKLLLNANCNNAIAINIDINEVSKNIHIDQNDHDYDKIVIILPESAYNDRTMHNSIINNIIDRVNSFV